MDRRTSCNAFWKALHHSSTYTFDYRNLAVLGVVCRCADKSPLIANYSQMQYDIRRVVDM